MKPWNFLYADGYPIGPHTRSQARRDARGYPDVPRSGAIGTAPGCASAPPRSERLISLRPTADLRDALAGIQWFNTLTRAERRRWLDVAGSSIPADAWVAFKRAPQGAEAAL